MAGAEAEQNQATLKLVIEQIPTRSHVPFGTAFRPSRRSTTTLAGLP